MINNVDFRNLKRILNVNFDDELLISAIFDMNKYYDSQFTDFMRLYQTKNNCVYNSSERKRIRAKFYYGDLYCCNNYFDVAKINYDNNSISDVSRSMILRIEKYDSDKIICSIVSKCNEILLGHSNDNCANWLSYYKNKTNNLFDYSIFVFRINQEFFDKNQQDTDRLCLIINRIYNKLENYRHLIIVFDDELKDKDGNIVTWECVSKIGVYCENFIQFDKPFYPFKKEQQINELEEFINERTHSNSSHAIADNFYKTISYGFKFEDCYVSDDSKTKMLVYKKIELDSSNIPCPSCMTTIQSGNSFPELFLKSWECKNKNCPDRSKSGRGKRFTEYGILRYFKMVENDPLNLIDIDLYKKWKRDIFPNNASWIEMVIKFYSYNNEKIGFLNIEKPQETHGRNFVSVDVNSKQPLVNSILKYCDLPIIKLLHEVNELVILNSGNKLFNKNIIPINGNSSNLLQDYKNGQIGSAITSPPYYNAREYSQWSTLIFYLIDMMISAKVIYFSLKNEGTYLYNIGDIVNEDNVYVKSNMSKKRLQLGFLSVALFSIAGYKLNGNIIWDKGEVQSKRNSTINLTSGYVKCINCYEHVFVFRKHYSPENVSRITSFSPVIKINCKGENTYKHTAPYPLEMVDLIEQFSNKCDYILDPFLGSGTTLKWCKIHGYKGVGFEINNDYFELCLKNINENQTNNAKHVEDSKKEK